MQHYAEEVARVIGLDTYSRADFLLKDKNEMFCLEANTLPGMTCLLYTSTAQQGAIRAIIPILSPAKRKTTTSR